jgi:hypothetical protein
VRLKIALGILPAVALGMAGAALAATQLGPSSYPPAVPAKPGGALRACPNPAGLVDFDSGTNRRGRAMRCPMVGGP